MPERVFLSKKKQPYIDVILNDGTYHHFTPHVLNVLLSSNQVQKFKRSSGWATVGVDPIRNVKEADNFYHGPERRSLHH
jgi:hypothetical protein